MKEMIILDEKKTKNGCPDSGSGYAYHGKFYDSVCGLAAVKWGRLETVSVIHGGSQGSIIIIWIPMESWRETGGLMTSTM